MYLMEEDTLEYLLMGLSNLYHALAKPLLVTLLANTFFKESIKRILNYYENNNTKITYQVDFP